MVFVPVLAIHHDPEFYPDPEVFDPTRFTKENIASRHPYAWLAFGEGKRNCIAKRFAVMQTRIGLITIFNNFKVTPSERTMLPMQFKPNSFFHSPNGGVHLRIETL